MDNSTLAVVITCSVTVVGFFLNGLFVGRTIDRWKAKDATRLAQFQSDLALQTQNTLEEKKSELALSTQQAVVKMQADMAALQRSRESRREALEILLNASSIAKSAAKALSHDLTNQSGVDRVQHVAESLQKMSPFFEKASEAERNLHLIPKDVSEVKNVQEALVTMLLLLDLDGDNQDLKRLDDALIHFGECVLTFQGYVRSATVE